MTLDMDVIIMIILVDQCGLRRILCFVLGSLTYRMVCIVIYC